MTGGTHLTEVGNAGVDVHPHEVEGDGPCATRPLPPCPGERDADDLAADDLAPGRRGEIERRAGEIEGADPLLEPLGTVAGRRQHHRLLGDKLVVIGRGWIVGEGQICGVGERRRELDVGRVNDDRVVRLAIDEAGDRRAVGTVDHCCPVGEAVGIGVGELIGP